MRRSVVLSAYYRTTYLDQTMVKHRLLCSKNVWSSFICVCNCMPLLKRPVNPIQDGPFQGCSWMGGRGCKKAPLLKICYTYPAIMKHGTVISYLQKIKKIYKSHDTHLELWWRQHFSLKFSKFCYIKKYWYRLHI